MKIFFLFLLIVTMFATFAFAGGGVENVRLMRQGQYNIGIGEPNVVNYAWTGTKIFKDDGKHDNLTFLMNLYSLSSQNPIRIIEIKGEQRDKLIEAYPWYDYYTLPAGMYNGQDEAVETIFLGGFVIANKDVPEDFIYNFVKAILGHGLEEIHTVFPAAQEVALDNALIGNATEWLPIHPEAKKYYKEVGLIK